MSDRRMVKLVWIPTRRAYAVWINGKLHNMVRLNPKLLPFSDAECQVEFE